MRYLLILLVFFVASCAGVPAARTTLAEQIATSGGLQVATLPAAPFLLTAYTRIDQPGAPADVYIEGDGLAWLGPSEPSSDPTPTDPIALRLAALDHASNVIYLARPCQYTKTTDGTACDQSYWTNARFAPAIIAATNAALDQLKTQNRLTGLHMVGFSGGAAVAVLATAQRHDVLSLRSVAGNLDTDAFTNFHHVSPLTGSLNPAEASPALATIPQRHFIGGDDVIIPSSVYAGYAARAGQTPCISAITIPGVSHEKGWTEHWPTLLAQPVSCQVR